MKLQMALDGVTLESAAELLIKVSNNVDIIEIGTPTVIEYGMEAVRTIRKLFPDKEILCDAKIMDGGAIEANSVFRAGSDYVTVMGVADKATVKAVVRLTHLGKDVHIVGDVTAPCAQAGDLLLIGSGSGETKSLLSAVEKAKSCGMRIVLTTINADSTLAKMADVAVVLPGTSQKIQNDVGEAPSIQPVGSSFEQLSMLVYDAAIMELMGILNRNNDEMLKRHANIE